MSFATPLKTVAKLIYDLSDEQVNGHLKEEVDPRYQVTPRYILQVLGTDACRKMIYHNTWVDYLIREYKKNFDPTRVTLVTDVRFENEMTAIKEQNGVVWKLIRNEGPGAKGGINGHASEIEQNSIPDNKFDTIIIAQSGDIEGLINNALVEYSKLALRLTEKEI